MIRVSLKALALLGVSTLALPLHAEDKSDCGGHARPCGARPDDATLDKRGVAPNLERGGADDAFRVTIDGSDKSTPADAQRAADVALHADRIDVQVTRLDGEPMLSLVPAQAAIAPGQPLPIFVEINYTAFVARAELRVFGETDGIEGQPRTLIPVTLGATPLWTPGEDDLGHLRIVLRVYDSAGHFDETSAADVTVTNAPPAANPDLRAGPSFENMRTRGNIAVAGTEVTVSGEALPDVARILAFGAQVPLSPDRRFVVRQIVPKNTREVAVDVVAKDGAVRALRRDIIVPSHDNFFVSIADVTAGHRSFGTAKLQLQGQDQGDPRRDFVDGRLAFYTRHALGDGWKLTASADTGEHPLDDLFDGFLRRDPRALLRRLQPERHYPIYGDDSTTVEDAPTYGRFYARVEGPDAEAMWGNFQTTLTGTDLIRYQRGLYGAQAKWRSAGSTANGERRITVTGFAADPGTIGAREDFISTGGSVYYFRNQDLAQGSERLFVEVRDRDSGLVLDRRELIAARDYEVNYLQGRVLLRDPLPIVADTSLFVRNASLAGNPVWLVASYEYEPGLTRPDALTLGGRGEGWLGDHVRVGVTGYHQGQDQSEQGLYGGDVLLRYKPGTWLRGEYARSNGVGNGQSLSSSGGYDFTNILTSGRPADAYIVEGAADLAELAKGANGTVSAYWRRRGAGFSGPGELTFGEVLDQYGGAADVEIAKGTRFQGKADVTDGTLTERRAVEAGLRHETAKGWFGSVGVRSDKQAGQATAYTPFPAPGNLTGTRTDVAASVGYRHTPATVAPSQDVAKPKSDLPWSAGLFGQKTVDRSGGRLENDRAGVTASVEPSSRLSLKGELSDGDLGFGADARATYQMGDRGSIYLGYALQGENPDAFNSGRLGRLTVGTKRRFSSAVNAFAEGRYEHGSGPTGLTQAYGVDFNPLPAWTFGTRYERGSLADALGGRVRREVIGGTVDYGGKALRLSSALEYRRDGLAALGTRETWATRNQLTWRVDPSLRLFARANLSISNGGNNATQLDADYYELVAAAAYRPVDNDRLNLLAKYTYLYDLPSPAQVDRLGLNLDFAQRSHVFAIDGTYQLTPRFSAGAKVAYRIGSLRASRNASAPWFSSDTLFWALRADYRVVQRWDVLGEIRRISVSEAHDARLGGLVGIYRHVGDTVKIGVGYNFTDYSDDLTDLSYNEHGFFVNLIGKF